MNTTNKNNAKEIDMTLGWTSMPVLGGKFSCQTNPDMVVDFIADARSLAAAPKASLLGNFWNLSTAPALRIRQAMTA